MREYIATTKGQQLAEETGLEELTNRLLVNSRTQPIVAIEYLVEDRGGRLTYPEDLIDEKISSARGKLTSANDLAMFDKAMRIDPESDYWRHVGDFENDTLFPIRSLTKFANASEEDRLILSGAIGLNLLSYRNQTPLLAKSRYREYGFDTFTESCAFVGAFVVGKFIDNEKRIIFRNEPQFSYTKDDELVTVSVGGSFHGDFAMSESRSKQADILSPVLTLTEFSPRQRFDVGGYHSIEPDIIATLIEAEFVRSGKEAAERLVNEFIEIGNNLFAPDPRNINKTPFVVPAFADYGDGDVRFKLSSLRLLLREDEYDPLKRNYAFYSAPYLPQSPIMFEIVPTNDGVKFQNKDENEDYAVKGIHVSRQQYGDLFTAILMQTSGGLGRTAPNQIFKLLEMAKQLFKGKNLEDID